MSKWVPVHTDVHIPTCAHVGYIDIFFYCTHLPASLRGTRKRAERRSGRNPQQQTEIKKFESLSDSRHISFSIYLSSLFI